MLSEVGGSSMKGARRFRLSLLQADAIREYRGASSERLKSVPGGPCLELTGGDSNYLATEGTGSDSLPPIVRAVQGIGIDALRERQSAGQLVRIKRLDGSRHRLSCSPANFRGDLKLAGHTHRGRERVVSLQQLVDWNTHGPTFPMSKVDPSHPSERGGLRSCRDKSSPIRTFVSQELNHIDLLLELDAPPRHRAFRIDRLPHP